MASIRRFENLKAWQASRLLVREVHAWDVDRADRPPSGTEAPGLPAAVLPIATHLACGFSTGSDALLAQHLHRARRAASAFQEALFPLRAAGRLPHRTFHRFYNLATDILRLIDGMLRYLYKNEAA